MKTNNQIYKLKKGDKVAIVAPSSPFNREGFDTAITFIKELGLIPVFNETIFNKINYLAGDDKSRAADFLSHLSNPQIKAIFCARGGYGSARILPFLEKRKIKFDKILMGYSDITALQLYLYKKTKKITFYGPNFTGHSFNKSEIHNFLMNPQAYNNKIQLQTLYKPNNCAKIIKAKTLGGCLTIISSMVGTGFLPSFKDAILYFEDTNEAPYRVDRLITQLILSKTISAIKAIVVGSMKNCDSDNHSWKDPLLDLAKQLKIPVFYNLDAGHENFSIVVPIGGNTTIDTITSEIKFESPFYKDTKE